MKNDDGTYSIYDNNRNTDEKSNLHMQIGVLGEANGNVSVNKKRWGLSSNKSITLVTGGLEYENVDLSLLDVGRAKASFDFNNNRIGVSAMASVWEPKATFKLFGFKVSVSAKVGSIGATAFLGKKENGETGFEVGASGGMGVSFGVSW